jgi:hypothetical protein
MELFPLLEQTPRVDVNEQPQQETTMEVSIEQWALLKCHSYYKLAEIQAFVL